MDTKQCRTCKEVKSVDDFHKRSEAKDGLQSSCKKCNIRRVRKWQKDNKEKFQGYWTNPVTIHRGRAARYGLTPEELDALIIEHPSCRICDAEGVKLVVDHDHETGKVRGMLCTRCNLRLGWVEKVGLEKIQKYLLGL